MIEMKGYENKSNQTNRRMINQQLLQHDNNNKKHKNKYQSIQQEDIDIFDKDFNVQPMHQPTKFLPQYQQQNRQTKSCVQGCLSCCGKLQICFAHLFACCGCKCFIYQLPSSSVGLVQEFGQFNRLLKPGFNLLNPCSEQVHQVDMRIRIISTPQTSVITKDNVQVKIYPSLAFRVTNPVIVYYILGDSVNKAVSQVVIASLRGVAGQHTLDYVLRDKKALVKQVNQRSISMIPPGIKIQQIFMEDVKIPREVEADLSSVAKQRRLAEAMLIQNQGNVESASLMKQTSQLLDSKAAMQIRYLQFIESLQNKPTVLLMDIGVDKKGFNSG